MRGAGALVMVGMVVILAACTPVADGDASTATAPGATTEALPQATSAVTTAATPTTATVVESTTSTGTIPPTIPATVGTVAITRVVFGDDPYALITNVGSTPADLEDMWLVGSTGVAPLEPVTLPPGRSAALVLGGEEPPQFVGIVAIIDLATALGPVVTSSGELGLFAAEAFTSPDAVVDYVAWGTGPHLNGAAAVTAGIWGSGSSVDLPAEALSMASPGTLGAGVEDWVAVIGG
ncbi:MAG: hypothetical protein H0V96_06765 [Acidimicrobiia bacterium]|nr:hypothetical protein [Acidimicrobiia bacterium]